MQRNARKQNRVGIVLVLVLLLIQAGVIAADPAIGVAPPPPSQLDNGAPPDTLVGGNNPGHHGDPNDYDLGNLTIILLLNMVIHPGQ